ncbi:hypothetical protein PQX77_010949 [Marasmius sp. AFHP31]|nr:hypothetical protein PQX77_010949 [Marasmius sp. AFHP31]
MVVGHLFLSLGLALWAVYHGVWATIPIKDIVNQDTGSPYLRGRYIVEVDSIAGSGFAPHTANVHKRLYEAMKINDVEYEISREFDSPGLFVGVSLTLKNPEDVSKLSNVHGVKAIRPLRKFYRPQPVSARVMNEDHREEILSNPQSTHVITGVDKVHAEGITGKGIKIGIIDSGIDYTHPALGGGFGPGFKIVGGYDLVGDDYDGYNTPVPDEDPLDQCSGHGTHVAGIIGADPSKNPFNMSGVAPSALLSAYRIFGCIGFATDDVVIDAMLLAVQEGQDVINLSLSGADGWTEGTTSVVASRIAQSGKVVTIAAGNDAGIGAWYTSEPANGIDVISVGSLDNTATTLQSAIVHGAEHDPIVYYNLFPLPVSDSLPIFATSNDTTVTDDACSPLPEGTPDLSPFLVVDQLTNIAEKGGQVALVYDDGSGFTSIYVANYTASLIQATDGEFLVKQFVAGVPITISFPQSGGSVQFPDPQGGLVSSFSSYGPTNDLFFKPAIIAPGGNILSTLPVTMESYGLSSGTSMAAPFVAGSAALLLEAKGKSTELVRSIRTLFETTAVAVSAEHGDDTVLQTLAQQGAGLIHVYNAVHSTTVVTPGELLLNDTANFVSEHRFTVHNTGPSERLFELSHIPAGTAITVAPETIFPANGPLSLNRDFATADLSDTSFILASGQSKTITATFVPPNGTDSTLFPVYSGFIQVTAEGDPPLHVSYLGLATSIKAKQVIDTTNVIYGINLPALLDAAGDVQEGPKNYTFDPDSGDFPTVFFRLTFGTPILRIDLVASDANIGASGRSGGALDDTVGRLYEATFVSRNDDVPRGNPVTEIALDTPAFANGTTIPNGTYRILLRTLRVTGDLGKGSDYESWLSPVVGVFVP